ncbi:sensor histidine kinase [Streptomyces apocyni]|uniref:sensor histidine kinase n=1 Tax=Streptomyces apocyni TaxID=2654677 RepID=UPI001E2CC24B|nr:sensor histidine kinase [Streptomyces apocyni]
MSPTPPTRGRRAHAGPAAEEQPETETPPRPPAGTPGQRWRLRPRTVRAKIVSLLMVPVVSLLGLWGFATVNTAQDVSRLRELRRVDEQVRAPIAEAVAALQAERAAAVRYAADPDKASGQTLKSRAEELKKLAQGTDRAVDELRLGQKHTVADSGDLPAGVAGRLESFVSGVQRLEPLRASVLDRGTGWDETYSQYTKAIQTAFGVGGALTGIQDAELGSDTRVLLEFSRAGELLARQDALLATARPGDPIDGERLHRFIGTAEARRTMTEAAVQDLRGPDRTAWRDLERSRAYRAVRTLEDKVLAASSTSKGADVFKGGGWDKAYPTVRDELRAIEADAARGAADRADPLTRGVLTLAGAAVLLGLLSVAASLVISVRIGRALVVELISLRNSALEIARHKLPQAMRRLRAGEELDIQAEAPPGPRADDETGQVSEALGTVHRAALHAAVERAELASGISGVFVNLARRSQVLVHRQLNLLDSMERRSDDPNELSDLFRLDHLTTRMRRHAESLIILSGAAPGRAWRLPVSLTDVVRAAVSEVEDYARVEVRQLPEAAVTGAAVADLTHLLAELVENAAQFSPPHTKVRVSGEPVGNGYALEVEDRGLGMGKERLAEANRRIEQSETLDLFDSDRLGLFVVSRLAARHNVKVHLRTSPYGGTTVVVLLPTALLQGAVTEGPAAARERLEAAAPRQHARLAAAGAPRAGGSGPVHGGPPRSGPAHEGPVHGGPVHEGPVHGGQAHGGQAHAGLAFGGPANASRTHSDSAPPPALSPARASSDEPTAVPPGVTPLRPHTRSHEAIAGNAADQAGEAPLGTVADDGDSHSDSELPRRVRQTHLAPQLRAERPADQPPDHAPDAVERTPEQVRDQMAAYRAGWARGGGRPSGAPGTLPGRDSNEGDHA